MALFDKLKLTIFRGRIRKEQIEELRRLIYNALSDGYISDFEAQEIRDYFKDSEVSPGEFLNLRTQIFQHVSQQVFADRKTTLEEKTALQNIAEKLEIPSHQYAWVGSQIQFFEFIEGIKKGNLPVVPMPTIILQKGEIQHISFPAVMMEKRYTGSRMSDPFSMNGFGKMNYTGGGYGDFQPQANIAVISQGKFIITNKRFIFAGDKISINASFDKLLSFNTYSDTLRLSFNARSEPLIIGLNQYTAEICGLILSKVANNI